MIHKIDATAFSMLNLSFYDQIDKLLTATKQHQYIDFACILKHVEQQTAKSLGQLDKSCIFLIRKFYS